MTRHRRRARTNSTHNQTAYRLTAAWPSTTRPTLFQTTDRRRLDKVARQLAGAGATVDIEEHTGHGAWTALRRLEPTRAQRPRTTATRPHAGSAEEHLDGVERLMSRPPIPRDGGKPTARTVAHGRGIR
ncbi:hypothetical protein CFP65_3279 [Kitasatospora sp. MMS16-BH015]|uniref:hypothetical protein n=1 Tax=Kitasatospora sp. MMS16-BH015 TaxID=2018025 RepID=UPI000CA1CA81|nr:hypothetical protein [Kitasatospora sp. MMS16-BH015]AUG78080.1 hypothetical protein CFP65_3279 [Kitasatospora sp. MMS16-BH015]